MKNIFIVTLFVIGVVFTNHAQDAKEIEIPEHAIGLRLGGGLGIGGEFTYQRHLFENKRIEANLGLRSTQDFTAYKLAGIYQWTWRITRAISVYAGPGVGIGTVQDNRSSKDHDDGVFSFVTGNIGVEYHFDVPIQIFLDFKPEFAIADYDVYNKFGPDVGIGVRYRM